MKLLRNIAYTITFFAFCYLFLATIAAVSLGALSFLIWDMGPLEILKAHVLHRVIILVSMILTGVFIVGNFMGDQK